MSVESHKSCYICGKSFPLGEFEYGGKDRSYCRSCNREDKAIRSKGGAQAARAFVANERSKWLDKPQPFIQAEQ